MWPNCDVFRLEMKWKTSFHLPSLQFLWRTFSFSALPKIVPFSTWQAFRKVKNCLLLSIVLHVSYGSMVGLILKEFFVRKAHFISLLLSAAVKFNTWGHHILNLFTIHYLYWGWAKGFTRCLLNQRQITSGVTGRDVLITKNIYFLYLLFLQSISFCPSSHVLAACCWWWWCSGFAI